MKKLRKRILSFLTLIALFVTGCGGPLYHCAPKVADLLIDGDAHEWDTGVYWFSNYSARLGLQNDSDYLYLMLGSAEDNFAMASFMGGLTVSFDSPSGKNIGIKLPVAEKKELSERREVDRQPSAPRERKMRIQPPEIEDIILIDSDGHERIFAIEKAREMGFDLAIAKNGDDLAIEIKMPLGEGLFGLEAVATEGKEIGLSIKSGKFESPMGADSQGKRPQGGQSGGFGGGEGEGGRPQGDRGGSPSGNMGGGPPQMGGGHSQNPPKIDIKMKVLLSI